MPLGNILIHTFNITVQKFTYLVGAYPVSAAISSFTSAFFIDKFDRKKVLLLGYAGFLLGTFLCSISSSYYFMFLARIVAGLLGGITYSQILAILADIIPFERRGIALGRLTGANALASILGVPLALYLANQISWQVPFIAVVIIGVAIFPFLFRYLPNVKSHITSNTANTSYTNTIKKIIGNNNTLLALLFSATIMLGHYLIIPFINPYLELNNGFSKNLIPIVYFIGGISSLWAGNYFGKQSDKFGKFTIFNLCVILSLPVILIITHISSIPFWATLPFFAIWYSSNTGRGVCANALVSNIIPQEQRGGFMSLNSCVQQLGTFTATLISGNIVETDTIGRIKNYSTLGYLSVAILIVSLVIAKYLFAQNKSFKIAFGIKSLSTLKELKSDYLYARIRQKML